MSKLKFLSMIAYKSLYLLLFTNAVFSQIQQFTSEEVIINSGRPTFGNLFTSVPGKIALEEHVGNSLFTGAFTTPPVDTNETNELNYDLPIYLGDILPRLTDIDSRVQEMDAANISVSILMFGSPGIQGVFNTTFATLAASFVNDEVSRIYANGNFSSRFGFWCSNALQGISEDNFPSPT